MEPPQPEPARRACEMPTCWCPQGRKRDEPWGPPGTDEDTRAWHITDDHIVPLFEGGPNTAANKRPAHRLCNRMGATIRRGGIPKKDKRGSRVRVRLGCPGTRPCWWALGAPTAAP